jgi:Tol biopolymer transport system component
MRSGFFIVMYIVRMKKSLLLLLSIAIGLAAPAQQPAGTEIYLLDLTIKESKIAVGDPVNITNRPGYDNQPSFHPDKSLLYYTSANDEGKTDLIEYNFRTKKSRKITQTTEREYSPTVTPDKKFLSCIIQRDNGAQDLGKYPIDGGEPTVLINSLTVGYHAWINSENLLLFVLGDTMTLQRYDLATNQSAVVAKSIGRSLHKIPGTSSMSFVQKIGESMSVLNKLNADGTVDAIVNTLNGREDLTWTPDGRVIMSDGRKLFYFQPGVSITWTEIEGPVMPSGTITRLTVNTEGNKVAIVVSE